MKNKWKEFSIEPRTEVWQKLEDKLDDNEGVLKIRSMMRWNVCMAAASVILVIGVSFFVVESISHLETQDLTDIRYIESSIELQSFSSSDIYKSGIQIIEGSESVELKVKI